jgi:hypothetical protein
MPRGRRCRRPGAAGVAAAPMLGVAVIAMLPAAAGPPTIRAAALPYVALAIYGVNLVILVVFGIWGFRIGTGWRDEGDGGGGQKGPDVEPPPPAGGRELTGDFPAWEQQFEAPEREGEREPARPSA